jgi:benzodiazapine receptor
LASEHSDFPRDDLILQPGRRSLIGFVALCLGASAIRFALTMPGVGSWYSALHKPTWTPPSWLFGPVWIALYLMMAIAAWMVWLQDRAPARMSAIELFLEQLVLNVAWPGCFFTFKSPRLAMLEIVLLWIAILATIIAFFRISKAAALLMTPYLAWVTFAAMLNFAIWKMNRV